MPSRGFAPSLAGLMILGGSLAAQPAKFASHPPKRPLPAASARPLEKGPAYFVDPAKGDDASDGSQAKPWKTLGHAVTKLKPGDTLYLRGGTYYEHVDDHLRRHRRSSRSRIRSYPGELAILDGGLREFFDNPATAWEPCPGGAAGEYRSAQDLSRPGRQAGRHQRAGPLRRFDGPAARLSLPQRPAQRAMSTGTSTRRPARTRTASTAAPASSTTAATAAFTSAWPIPR